MGAGNMGSAAGREMSRRMRQQQGSEIGGMPPPPPRDVQAGGSGGYFRGRGPFQFGADNEIGGMGAPAFGEEMRDADLSDPNAGKPDPDAIRAVAGANRRRMARRGEERQRRFMERMPRGGKGTFSETETINGETTKRSGSFDPSEGSPFKLGKGIDFGAGRARRDSEYSFGMDSDIGGFGAPSEQMPGEGVGQPGMQPDASIGSDVGFDFGALMGGPKQQFEEQMQAKAPVPGQSLQAGERAEQIRASLAERRGAAGKRRMPTIDEDYFSL
jgi:hypothetical protein